MANKLFTSERSEDIINKVHSLLWLQNKFYIVWRLAISIWLINNKELTLDDTKWKEFNEYTLLNNENYYDTLIKNIIKDIYNSDKISDDDFFWNQSILKKALDYWCKILDSIYIESNWNADNFLKKLYSLKYDKVFLNDLKEDTKNNNTLISENKNTILNDTKIVKKDNENSYADEMVLKVKEFLENFNYNINESLYTLSNSVIRVKIKLPLWKPINSITNKVDDLKLHLWINEDIIIWPISWYLCFDIPRKDREIVYLKDIIDRIEYNSNVKFPLWTNTDNEIVSLDLSNSNTPHLLIAGATWQWKSEGLKSIIATLISKNSSEDIKLILIDPKKVEFSRFKWIPHLSWNIITEIEEAIVALEWAVVEMNKRYDLLSEYQVNSIDKYNKISINKMPKQIIIFDEFADFILSWKEEKERLEDSIKKLSWKARAAWIHLILSTQRPDKDIITWVIKANLPAKIAFKTWSPINSQIIIDSPDASKLFWKWDMLLSKEWVLTRIQWAFISDEELDEIILSLK